MIRLWAPTLQWCMLANSGILMVKEAGGIVIDYDGNPFNGMNAELYLITCHPGDKNKHIKTKI